MKNKFLTAALLVFITAQAQASEWAPLVTCGNRALVVDKTSQPIYAGRGGIIGYQDYFQLVLNSRDILDDFVAKGAIPPHAREVQVTGEFVTNLRPDHGSTTEFYNVFAGGRTVTVRLYGDVVVLAVYSPGFENSRLLAHFEFRDCR
ncbi:MAG: hypothetical protein RJB38_2395 [Pseudomonadota bacterium]